VSDPYERFKVDPRRSASSRFCAPAKRQDQAAGRDGRCAYPVHEGREIFSAYLPTPKGPVFMSLIEKTFGKEQTTRTWDTIAKVAV